MTPCSVQKNMRRFAVCLHLTDTTSLKDKDFGISAYFVGKEANPQEDLGGDLSPTNFPTDLSTGIVDILPRK